MDADRNLLFAVLVLQADVIDADKFIQVCTLWTARKQTAPDRRFSIRTVVRPGILMKFATGYWAAQAPTTGSDSQDDPPFRAADPSRR